VHGKDWFNPETGKVGDQAVKRGEPFVEEDSDILLNSRGCVRETRS